MNDAHFVHSSHREAVLQHIFVGESLRRLWIRGDHSVEVLHAEVDAAGYDIVLEVDNVIRHIQLKSSFNGSTTRNQTVSTKLCKKPAGCVLWLGFDPDTLELGPFYFLGSAPFHRLRNIFKEFPRARHTKGDSTGYKAERAHSHRVPKSAFDRLETLDEVLDRLFGPKT